MGWNFDNSYARLPKSLFTRMNPTPVRSPKLVIFNSSLAASLGLNGECLQSEEGVEILGGNKLPEGSEPIAQAYAGHQFGYFTMLGDGRAILLGEQITPEGERFDIQLKGSGRTPYSRNGDGRAALGPMLREYIISEAMHALGIPTTRSLAVVTTGEPVYREKVLQGAILTRVAKSHIRVGTFQYVRVWRTLDELRKLADYAIDRHYPEVNGENPSTRYVAFLKEVVKSQAALIAKWQLVGFIHGVMNTDNMAISGETIDYGPCAFMDRYDPATVFSSIDHYGRYAYQNQPYIGAWNLARFAETLLPLLAEDEKIAVTIAQDVVSKFHDFYNEYWLSGMRAKLGLFNQEEEDEKLIKDLLSLMEKHQADFTNTFLALTFQKLEGSPVFCTEEFREWLKRWQSRLLKQPEPIDLAYERMRANNPALIPRNHRVEEVLKLAVGQGEFRKMEQFLNALSKPYAHSHDQVDYSLPPPPSNERYVTYCGT